MGLLFTGISLAVYGLFYILFHDAEFISHHFMIDLAFLPIEVLLVATVFERIMGRREKEARLDRMHMVVGSFFYEVGNDLVKSFVVYDVNAKDIGQHMILNENWSNSDFESVILNFKKTDFQMPKDATIFIQLRELLSSKREYFLRLMENDNLSESEHFSQLLIAIFHLSEELYLRMDLNRLQSKDFAHLSNDVKRAYVLLIEQWINYLYHMKEKTPYLFSLAIRTNPFNPKARVEVE